MLVSEVMLQQTRVETVLGYYGRWLERFPDLDSLARADVDDVLKAWEGLGYYRRARNLHRAALAVHERPGGALPSSFAELEELPGVGEYTAGAVASIAFGEAVPAVDGNARRVLARLYDVPDPKPTWLRERAAELVDRDRPGDWNQALMELGATVCAPRGPKCGTCPWARWCGARAAGTQTERPAAKARRDVPATTFALAVLRSEGRVLLERRPAGGLLGGLWAFPERSVSSPGAAERAAVAMATELAAGPTGSPEPLPIVEHAFTHLAATYVPWIVPVRSLPRGRGRVRIDPGEPPSVALPAAQRRVLEALAARA